MDETLNKNTGFSWFKTLMPYLVLAILLSLSVSTWLSFKNLHVEKAERMFDKEISEKISRITDRLEKYQMALLGGVGVFMASEQVRRAEWLAYVDYLKTRIRFPGIQGIGFSQIIRPEELARHIQSIRAQGFPDYTVRPDGERDEYTAITFLEPFDARNQRAFGYDMFSEPVRRAAMTRARDTGDVSMSGRVTLVQETDQDIQLGFLIYVPVYARGMPLNSLQERKAAIQGYVYAPFRIKDLMQSIFGEIKHKVEFNLYDGAEISPAALMYDSHVSPGASDKRNRPIFSATRTLYLYGHQLTLAFDSTPLFEAEVGADAFFHKIIFGSEITISLLIFFMLKMMVTRSDRVQEMKEMKVKNALQNSEERYRILFDQLPVGVVIFDVKTLLPIAFNDVAASQMGYSREEFSRLKISDYDPPETPVQTRAHIERLLQNTENQFETLYRTKTGEIRNMRVNIRMMSIKEKSYSNCVFQDITAEKEAEQELIARKTAEAASRHKSQFLSNMSHEIRTPMNAIMGFAQILEPDPSLSSEQRDQVRSINRSGQHLLRLIDDILDISKIEAGKIELTAAVFCFGDFLDDIEMMFRSRTEAKGLQLLVERDAELPAWVRGDEGKLRQILVNLLGNAIKFTESGGVCLRVGSEGPADPNHRDEEGKALRLVFEVEDTGPGISISDQARIFKTFDQAEAGAKKGGTGLGLAISQRLVEMMGGKLTVESVVGKSSCFRFEALLEPARALQETEKPDSRRVVGLESGSGPWRVLVVDDVADNRDLVCKLLAPLEFELREATNGQEAIDIFEEWSPHAVFMDIRMPVMDGYEATRRIKATEKGATTPVIAVTASVSKDAEEDVLAMGISAYLRKPFQVEALYEALGQCLGLGYVYADEPSEAPDPPKTPALTQKSLAALPRDLIQDMAEAVDEGDTARLAELILRVEPLDSTAAQGLKALAGRYDYTTLSKLLNKGENDNE